MTDIIFSDEQKEKYNRWAENHDCSLRDRNTGIRYRGAIGGCDTFICVPTSIGWSITVTCSCGAIIDITKL